MLTNKKAWFQQLSMVKNHTHKISLPLACQKHASVVTASSLLKNSISFSYRQKWSAPYLPLSPYMQLLNWKISTCLAQTRCKVHTLHMVYARHAELLTQPFPAFPRCSNSLCAEFKMRHTDCMVNYLKNATVLCLLQAWLYILHHTHVYMYVQ